MFGNQVERPVFRKHKPVLRLLTIAFLAATFAGCAPATEPTPGGSIFGETSKPAPTVEKAPTPSEDTSSRLETSYSEEEIDACGKFGGITVCRIRNGDVLKSEKSTLQGEFSLTTEKDRKTPVCVIRTEDGAVYALTQYTNKEVGPNLPAWFRESDLTSCYVLEKRISPTIKPTVPSPERGPLGIEFSGVNQDELEKIISSIMIDSEMAKLCQDEGNRIKIKFGTYPIYEGETYAGQKEAYGRSDVFPDRIEITILDSAGVKKLFGLLGLPEELIQEYGALHELCHACAQGEKEFSLKDAENIGIICSDPNAKSIQTKGFKVNVVDGQGNIIGGNINMEEIICGILTRQEAFPDPELKKIVEREDFWAPNYEGFLIFLDSASGQSKGQIYREILSLKEKGDIGGLWGLIKERTEKILKEAGQSDSDAEENATNVARIFISYGVSHSQVQEADRRFAEALEATGYFTLKEIE